MAQVSLDSFKLGCLVNMSSELLSDAESVFGIENYIGDQIGAAIGRKANEFFSIGTGTNQPQGYINAGTGKTTASATALTLDEIISLVHSVLPVYRARNAAFIANDLIWDHVRKLKDGDSQYLWQPSLQMGMPDRLLGYQVWSDPNMDSAITTGKKTMVFGDISTLFIRYSGGLRVDTSTEVNFANDQVVVRGLMSVDSVLTDTNAIKKMVQA
jgi:HK97 family phage major capsid protein